MQHYTRLTRVQFSHITRAKHAYCTLPHANAFKQKLRAEYEVIRSQTHPAGDYRGFSSSEELACHQLYLPQTFRTPNILVLILRPFS